MKQSIAVVFILAMMTVVFAPSASASKVDPLKLNEVKPKVVKKEKPKKEEPVVPAIPVVKEYVVIPGDTLNKIGEAHGTSWQRLWQKNTNLTNPDILNIGDKLIIPTASEVLADRPLPTAPAAGSIAQQSRAAVPGNGYSPGYCTWYVKNMRPDIGNFWGNADQWSYSAQAAGYTVNSTPSAGSIGVAVAYMHVVYVQSVNSDGTINISEMNYVQFGVVSSRTASVGEFVYIH